MQTDPSLTSIILFGATLLGAILGSFINALSFRYHSGVSMNGRSKCMRCGHTLGALDLIPVFSYLGLRGRCRYCRTRISPQYPLIELLAACVSFLFAFTVQTVLAYVFLLLIGMTLLFAVVYDLRHTVLPGTALAVLGLLSLGQLFVACAGTCGLIYPALWPLLAGPVLAAPLLALSAVSRGTWMGWGDGLLELSLGWLLGIAAGVTALMLAFWSGALVGIALLIYSGRSRGGKGKVTMKSELPFAPFLVLGAAAAHFLHVDFFASMLPW